MQFGIELVPNEPVFKIASYVKLAEDNGFTHAWITDHYNNRELYSTLSVLCLATGRIRIGAGVTNPYTRNVAVTASGICSVNELSGGRAMLGIGPGDKATFDALGISREKPLERIRETVDVLRGFMTGKTVTYEGNQVKISGAGLSFRPGGAGGRIPVYIGAQGPKMLELAGMIGDGVLINGSHPSDFISAVPLIRKGIDARDAGDHDGAGAADDFDIAAYTCFSIDKNPEKARAAAVPVVAFIAAGAPDALLEKHGISASDRDAVAGYLKEGRFSDLKDIVTDRMIEAFSIAGDRDACIERINELEDCGVTRIIAGSPIGPDKEKSIKLIGDIIRSYGRAP